MKANLRMFALAVVTVLLLPGCSGNDNPVNPSGQATDQGQVTATLGAGASLLENDLFFSTAQTNLSGARPGGSGSGTVAITQLWFWRSITSAQRTFDFAFSDTDSTGHPTLADVTVNWHFLGRFNIAKLAASGRPNDVTIVRKPLDDTWVQNVRLRRTTTPEDPNHVLWRISAASGADVTSKNATTQIVSVRLQSAALDTTITDPLALVLLGQVLRFPAGDTVQVTVTTARNNDVVLLPVVFLYQHDLRTRMTNNGDNTYTGTLHTGLIEGWRHFAVNALSHGTLYDDTLPYDSRAWVFPYTIASSPTIDTIP